MAGGIAGGVGVGVGVGVEVGDGAAERRVGSGIAGEAPEELAITHDLNSAPSTPNLRR